MFDQLIFDKIIFVWNSLFLEGVTPRLILRLKLLETKIFLVNKK